MTAQHLLTGTFTVNYAKTGYKALTDAPELKSNLTVNMGLSVDPAAPAAPQ